MAVLQLLHPQWSLLACWLIPMAVNQGLSPSKAARA